jgi:hypothetical protein
VTVTRNEINDLLNGSVTGNGDHFRAGNHDLADKRIAEFQDALDHLAGLRIDQAIFLAGVNDRLDFLFQAR